VKIEVTVTTANSVTSSAHPSTAAVYRRACGLDALEFLSFKILSMSSSFIVECCVAPGSSVLTPESEFCYICNGGISRGQDITIFWAICSGSTRRNLDGRVYHRPCFFEVMYDRLQEHITSGWATGQRLCMLLLAITVQGYQGRRGPNQWRLPHTFPSCKSRLLPNRFRAL